MKHTPQWTLRLVMVAACLMCMGFTRGVTVTRILSGNTVVTSDNTIIHIVGENGKNQPFVFTCVEPDAFDFATSVLQSNEVTIAYRGRHENGVAFAAVLINGKSYVAQLEARGLIKTRSPDAFADKVAKTIRAPSRWLHKPQRSSKQPPTILGEFFRGLADNLESQKLAGRTQFERDTNASLNDAVREYRKMGDVYDTPWQDFGSGEMRDLWKSANRLEQIPEEMNERNTQEVLQQLGLD